MISIIEEGLRLELKKWRTIALVSFTFHAGTVLLIVLERLVFNAS